MEDKTLEIEIAELNELLAKAFGTSDSRELEIPSILVDQTIWNVPTE